MYKILQCLLTVMFLISFASRITGHCWKYSICIALWLVDLFILLLGQSADVLYHCWDPIWYVRVHLSFILVNSPFYLHCDTLFSLESVLSYLLIGKLCLELSGYFLWPFGKALQKVSAKCICGKFLKSIYVACSSIFFILSHC